MSSVFDLDEPVRDDPAVTVAMPRRRLAVGALACVAAAAVLAGWFAPREPVRDDVARPTAIGTSAAMAVAAVVEVAGPDASHPTATPADDGTVEICGLGRFPAQALRDDHVAAALLRATTQEAERRTIDTLVARPDERSRATGQFLRAVTSGIDVAAAQRDALNRDGVDCATQRCDRAPLSTEATSAKDALVRMATGTRDPWVYALAFHGCETPALFGAAPGCQMLSVARWTQLDPDNAIPWLHAAAEAQRRGDGPALAEAIYRASQARRSDTRFAQVTAVAHAAQPPDVAPSAGLLLDMQTLASETALSFTTDQVALHQCSQERLADPNRRAVCGGLAEVLAEHGTGLPDLDIGLAIGKRLGWPAERIASIEESRDAYYGSSLASDGVAANGSLQLDCEAVRGRRGHLALVAERGEIGALKERLARSSRTRADLAAQHRHAMAELQRRASGGMAASAAGAAGAASAPDGILRTASPTP